MRGWGNDIIMSATPSPPTPTAVSAHYAFLAPIYDRIWARYLEATLSRTITMMALQGTESILDVGCGTGELERRIVHIHPQQSIIGLDLTQAMLARARAKLSAYPQLQFIEGDSQQLPFPDASFEIVVSCSALHYMRDPQRVIRECARVLRPGGRVIITDWCRDFWLAKFYNAFRKAFIRAHHQVYRLDELQEFLRNAGLEPTQHTTFSVQGIWKMMGVEARKH